jgi:hypothetical protein
MGGVVPDLLGDRTARSTSWMIGSSISFLVDRSEPLSSHSMRLCSRQRAARRSSATPRAAGILLLARTASRRAGSRQGRSILRRRTRAGPTASSPGASGSCVLGQERCRGAVITRASPPPPLSAREPRASSLFQDLGHEAVVTSPFARSLFAEPDVAVEMTVQTTYVAMATPVPASSAPSPAVFSHIGSPFGASFPRNASAPPPLRPKTRRHPATRPGSRSRDVALAVGRDAHAPLILDARELDVP